MADAIEAAWQRSPEHPAAVGRVRRAEAERTAAQALWAAPPAVEMDVRQGRAQPAGRIRESEIGLSWPLWLPGQRGAKADAAGAESRAAQHALQAAKLKIAGEVREAALGAAAVQAEARQAELQVRLLKALADDVDRRVKAGDLARADAIAARAELLAATAAQSEAGQRAQVARARWRLLTGLDAIPNAETLADAGAQLNADHPELALATAQSERARQRLRLAERSRRDPPELGVRYRRDEGASGAGNENSVGVSLRVPLATADRNGPMLAAAQSELDVVEAEERRVRERLASDLENARAALRLANEQLKAERERATLLRERAELIEKSLRAGESGLPDTLRALALAAQADTAVVRQEAALNLARARLHQAQGLLP